MQKYGGDIAVTAASTAATVAALAPAGLPAVAVAGAMPLVEAIAQRAYRRHAERAGVALGVGAELAGLTAAEAAEKIVEDPALLDMAQVVLAAAAESRDEAKLRLLAGLLADGLLAADSDHSDMLRVRASVLRELDGPHVRMLFRATGPVPGTPDETGWSREQLEEADAVLAPVLDVVLATLVRLGLVFDSAVGTTYDGVGRDRERWATTGFGDDLLRRLTQAAAAISAES